MENKTVKISHKTTCSDTPAQLKGEESSTPIFEHSFDFSNCSEQEILDMAATNMIIVWRARNSVKNKSEEEVRALPTDIDVKEFLSSTRTRGKSNTEKASNLLNKMSPAELEEIKAMLEARENNK